MLVLTLIVFIFSGPEEKSWWGEIKETKIISSRRLGKSFNVLEPTDEHFLQIFWFRFISPFLCLVTVFFFLYFFFCLLNRVFRCEGFVSFWCTFVLQSWFHTEINFSRVLFYLFLRRLIFLNLFTKIYSTTFSIACVSVLLSFGVRHCQLWFGTNLEKYIICSCQCKYFLNEKIFYQIRRNPYHMM